MRDSTTTPCVLFPELFDRPLTATFDVPNASSDGGAILLKAADRRLGLIRRLAAALVDERQSGKVRHALAGLLGQRIHGLALGYANDAPRLVDDPVHKLLLGRDPVHGDALASQPTLSRFENDVTDRELLALSEARMATKLRKSDSTKAGRRPAQPPSPGSRAFESVRILISVMGPFSAAC